MKLSKKESARIATLINDLVVSNMLYNSAKDTNNPDMVKYNDDNNIAIVALYDEFKIKLCTYDVAYKSIGKITL